MKNRVYKNNLQFIAKSKRYENGNFKITCKCLDCGTVSDYWENALYSGNPLCQCKRPWKNQKKLASIWNNMHTRCCNPKSDRYPQYGGRGIKMCDEWMNFKNFVDWSIANGYKDGLSIERKDVNGNYEPSNCIWIELKLQMRNKQNSVFVEIDGVSKHIKEWCEEFNINYPTALYRYKKGYTGMDIFRKGRYQNNRWTNEVKYIDEIKERGNKHESNSNSFNGN